MCISDSFFHSFDLNLVKAVHTFLPIRNKSEIDTWHFIRHLRDKFPSIDIAISKSDRMTTGLSTCLLTAKTILKENEWGIPEPEHCIAYPETGLDLALVPLLAFDMKGNRVGYGKGFYDRFFKKCRPGIVKVGLSFFEAEDSIKEISAHDVPLDYCITPLRVYAF